MKEPVPRRKFLKVSGAITVAACVPTSPLVSQEATVHSLPQRVLGRTGARVTIVGLGGEHVLSRENNDAAAEELVQTALNLGVNYFDTAELYYPSEKYIGQALDGRRKEAFISTKVDPRDPDEAKRKIERSLKLLRTDRVDNLNIHRVRNAEDVERICKKGGLLEVIQSAKEQGMTRFIGISGHYLPEPMIEMMRRADLDTILLPVNPADRYHRPFKPVWEEAKRRSIGVVAMKVSGRGRLFSECGFTEMDPLLTYALSQDVHTAIVGVETVEQLRDNVRIAREFKPMSAPEQKALEERIRPHAPIAGFYKRGGSGWLD